MTQDHVKPISLAECQNYLPPRLPNSHKGNYGHVLIIGGDYGMAGAPRLAGEAALRTGAGLVSIATRPEHALVIAGNYPELMCHGIKEAESLLPLLEKATVVVIGPGLGQDTWGANLLQLTLENVDSFYYLKEDATGEIDKKINAYKTLIVDADALNLLSISKETPIKTYFLPEKIRRDNWILTPHPAEAGRLLGCSTSEIQDDRFAAIQKLKDKYRGVIALKGSGTLTLGDSNEIRQCTAGNPGMATAGMGDILTGIIAGLVAQHLSLEHAVNLGVTAHAAASDMAAYQHGQRGLNARDILGPLRTCLNPIQ